MAFPSKEVTIRGKTYKSISEASRCEGVTPVTIRKYRKLGKLDEIGKEMKRGPRTKIKSFVVRGYTYKSYSECGRWHGVSGSTVKAYVEAGRNDELPPRFTYGRSEYLDKQHDKMLEKLENYKRNRLERDKAKRNAG